MPVRVVIVDDHPVFRRSARQLLERDGFEVVGEAGDGAAALKVARELEPDVLLLDIALPDTSGFEVADALAGTAARIVLVSSRDAADFGPRLRQTRAAGFIPKDELTAGAVRALLESR